MVVSPVLRSEHADTADRSAQVGALSTVAGMRSALQFAGVVLVAVGVSGTIDRLLGYQPIFGFLNVVNRFLIPTVDGLGGYELYANLSVVVLGVVVFASSGMARRADRGTR
jgi:hypothetical protein